MFNVWLAHRPFLISNPARFVPDSVIDEVFIYWRLAHLRVEGRVVDDDDRLPSAAALRIGLITALDPLVCLLLFFFFFFLFLFISIILLLRVIIVVISLYQGIERQIFDLDLVQ